MKKITLIATCAFGLEAVVKREIIKLGFDDIKVSDGKVEFLANVNDIAKVNWIKNNLKELRISLIFSSLFF